MRKAFSLMFTLCLMGIMGVNTASAGCAVVGNNFEGVSVRTEISCNFPVFVDTGNPESDHVAYSDEKEAWKTAHPEDYAVIVSLAGVYFEIQQSDLDAMPAGKRSAILSNPEMYHIIP